MKRKDLESIIIETYKPEDIDSPPTTERELLECYCKCTDPLYQYLRLEKRNYFIHAVSNEIRAMMGHLADYRDKNNQNSKRNLEKAYGHFRRLNLDLLKLLCNQYDEAFSAKIAQEYHYDFRGINRNYLKQFGEKYFKAKALYEKAQHEESVGSDKGVHNIFAIYYDAVVSYIRLRQFYDKYKTAIQRARRKAITLFVKLVVSDF